jgi:hypothetical protein
MLGQHAGPGVVRWRSLTVLACLAFGVAGVAAPPAGATPTTCATVSITQLDTALGIDASHVTASHPASPVGALICSYYGDTGRAANEATVNYLPATAKAFRAVKASLSTSHAIRTITGIKSGAYSYSVGSERYLYVLDGSSQVQIFATIALAKLETLARALPVLP